MNVRKRVKKKEERGWKCEKEEWPYRWRKKSIFLVEMSQGGAAVQ